MRASHSGFIRRRRFVILLAPVGQYVDNAIHRINLYPLESAIGFLNTYPLHSDLSDPRFFLGGGFFLLTAPGSPRMFRSRTLT